MELIRRAVERARGGEGGHVSTPPRQFSSLPPIVTAPALDPVNETLQEIPLQPATLERNRIIAHDLAHPLRKAFDILRTQVLQAMDEKDFHVLAITSPRPACGKTVTALNLALSIARQPHRSALVVDMDLERPRVASYLGLPRDRGLLGVLSGELSLQEAILHARIGDLPLSALIAEGATDDSSAWMASQEMSDALRNIRQRYRSQTVIVDLPPMLTSDDVLAILPQIDAVLLVAATGVSTVSEIEDCSRHLQSTEVLKVVLNKAAEEAKAYTAGYY